MGSYTHEYTHAHTHTQSHALIHEGLLKWQNIVQVEEITTHYRNDKLSMCGDLIRVVMVVDFEV